MRKFLSIPLAIAAFGACSSPSDPAFNNLTSSSASGDASAASSSGSSGLVVDRTSIVSKGDLGFAQIEPDLAVGPSGELAIVFIADAGVFQIGLVRSSDDGATWTAPEAVSAPGGRSGVDPSAAFDADGTLYVAFLGIRYDANGGTSDRHAYVTKYPKGAPAELPLEISNPAKNDSYDKPWILPLLPKGLLVTVTTESGSRVDLARTLDGGAWDLQSLMPDGTLRQLAYPCTGGDGKRVHIVNVTPGGLELVSSADNGVTWSKPVVVSEGGEPVAFDPPTCTSDGAHVWITYGVLGTAGSEDSSDLSARARIARSDDGGATIAARGEAFSGGDFLHPVASRGGGPLMAMTYARTQANDGEVRVAWGADLDSLGAPVTLFSPITFITLRTGLDWLGDYPGLVVRDRVLRAAIVDNRSKPPSSIRYVRAHVP